MPFYLPNKCLRGRSDCQPLAQIESDNGISFICCGHNDRTSRTIPKDEFRVCWKNAEIDEMSDWDKRDITDTISILAQALSIDENIKNNTKDKE